MPTGNEFQDVRFGQQDQSYKQTDREMSGGVDGQAVGNGPQPSSGQYPNTFDGTTPSEPKTVDYYPESVFSHIPASGPGQSYTQHGGSVGGEYGQSDGITNPTYPSNNMVPDSVPSKQFSSDKEGDPKKLLALAHQSVDAHADLMNAYGYHQPVATLGCHPWLRDELSNPTELEPAAAAPRPGLKVPEIAKAGK